MKELEDVKHAAEEFMKKQIHLFSLMTLLNSNEMKEFHDWFNKHPYKCALERNPTSFIVEIICNSQLEADYCLNVHHLMRYLKGTKNS